MKKCHSMGPAAILVLAAIATAQAEPEMIEPIPADEATLAALGYPANAGNLFMLPATDQTEAVSERASLDGTPPGAARHANIAGSAFVPTRGPLNHRKGPDGFITAGSLVTDVAGGTFEYQLTLPQGVSLR